MVRAKVIVNGLAEGSARAHKGSAGEKSRFKAPIEGEQACWNHLF